MVNIVIAALFIVKPILENSVVMAELSPNCDVHRVYLYGVHETPKISENEYNSLSYGERMNFLKNVISDAGVKLGLSDEIIVIVKDLEKEKFKGNHTSLYLEGYYSSLSNAIFIDRDHIEKDTLKDCVNTVLHELNHYYFYRVFKCLDKLDDNDKKLQYFHLANELMENNKHYIDTDDLQVYEYPKYFDQPLEVEARQYADKEACNYIESESGND